MAGGKKRRNRAVFAPGRLLGAKGRDCGPVRGAGWKIFFYCIFGAVGNAWAGHGGRRDMLNIAPKYVKKMTG